MKFSAKNLVAIFFFVLLVILGMTSKSQATVSISATVNKTHLTLEDTLILSVKINGVRESAEPVLPPLPDFQIQPQGTSSSIQVINGKMKATLTFKYALFPKRTGTFTIGAIRLERDGKSYQSPSITVDVSETSSNLPDGEKNVFAEAIVSKSTAYLQEQIRLTYRFYRKVEVRNLSLDAPLEHFRKIPLGEPTETSRVINGVRYYVSEINYALYPLQSGVVKIPAATFQLDVVNRNGGGRRPFGSRHFPGSIFDDPFFSGGATLDRKILRTRTIDIKVLPFPEKNKPKNFQSLVGEIALDSRLSVDSLKVGETATWILTLKGRGNLEGVSIEVPENTSEYKVYKDQPVLDERAVAGYIEATKSFTTALVPIKEGSLKLPKVKIGYWDPKENIYRMVTTKDQILSVSGGQSNSMNISPSDSSREIRSQPAVGPGLLPIHTRTEYFDDPGSFTTSNTFKFAAFIMPILGYLMFRSFYGNRLRKKRDHVFAKKQEAFPKAVKRLEGLGKQGKPTKAKDVSAIFREYLGDRFEFQGTALTPEEVDDKLKHKELSENHIAAALSLLDKCQTAEFTPDGLRGNDDLVAESLSLINTLEKTRA
ncbi:MAG: protein BatD [Candidatus Nitronauta litoralis]|uniref:Protein BatD n=1 Tax=Candidatus Nitronauta litoralis TaxID=2705533 RepID=A0A7T0BYA9_9BACT|nr:MAG: protein BatD [Candidatus Nitronauta litoralis]